MKASANPEIIIAALLLLINCAFVSENILIASLSARLI